MKRSHNFFSYTFTIRVIAFLVLVTCLHVAAFWGSTVFFPSWPLSPYFRYGLVAKYCIFCASFLVLAIRRYYKYTHFNEIPSPPDISEFLRRRPKPTLLDRARWFWDDVCELYHALRHGCFYVTTHDFKEVERVVTGWNIEQNRPNTVVDRELIGRPSYLHYSPSTRKTSWTTLRSGASVFSGLAAILFCRHFRKKFPHKVVECVSVQDAAFMDHVYSAD